MKKVLIKAAAVACGLVFVLNYLSGLRTALIYSGASIAAMGISLVLGGYFCYLIEGKREEEDAE